MKSGERRCLSPLRAMSSFFWLAGVLDLGRHALAERVRLVRVRAVLRLEGGRVGLQLGRALLRGIDRCAHLGGSDYLCRLRDAANESVLVIRADAPLGREPGRVGSTRAAALGGGICAVSRYSTIGGRESITARSSTPAFSRSARRWASVAGGIVPSACRNSLNRTAPSWDT